MSRVRYKELSQKYRYNVRLLRFYFNARRGILNRFGTGVRKSCIKDLINIIRNQRIALGV